MKAAFYETLYYKVCPNETRTGYYLLNKKTNIREGETTFLASAIKECDKQTKELGEVLPLIEGEGLYRLA